MSEMFAPDPGRSLLIESAARVLAAGLAEPDDVKQGHGLGSEEIELAVALAAAEPGNSFVVPKGASGEPLALLLETGALVVGTRLATIERYRERCLAERDDADELAELVQTLALQHGPPPRRPSPAVLSNDDGVLPSVRSGEAPAAPAPPPAHVARCAAGSHRWGPDPRGRPDFSRCLDCGSTTRTAPPSPPLF